MRVVSCDRLGISLQLSSRSDKKTIKCELTFPVPPSPTSTSLNVGGARAEAASAIVENTRTVFGADLM